MSGRPRVAAGSAAALQESARARARASRSLACTRVVRARTWRENRIHLPHTRFMTFVIVCRQSCRLLFSVSAPNQGSNEHFPRSSRQAFPEESKLSLRLRNYTTNIGLQRQLSRIGCINSHRKPHSKLDPRSMQLTHTYACRQSSHRGLLIPRVHVHARAFAHTTCQHTRAREYRANRSHLTQGDADDACTRRMHAQRSRTQMLREASTGGARLLITFGAQRGSAR